MGSMQLDCPLCCGEKFTCQETLKYHLLSMTVNLYCPACNELCDSIQQLADHLGTNCGKDNEEELRQFVKIEPVEEVSNDATEKNGSSILAKALMTEEEIMKISKGANGDMNVNIIEICNNEAFDEGDNENITNQATINEEGELILPTDDITSIDGADVMDVITNEVYFCSSCNVNFNASLVMEHVQQFHDGQEVVLQVNENGADGSLEMTYQLDEDSSVLQPIEQIREQEESGNESEEVDVDSFKYPQILNTLKQEECVDKDGRLYTRKVVQIEKFWDNEKSSTSKRRAIAQVYEVDDDGKLTKLDGEDLLKKDAQQTAINRKRIQLIHCSRCQMQFSKTNQFGKHVCDLERSSDYKCSQCDSGFSNPKSLCAHMKIHKIVKSEPIAVPPFLCTKCDTIFPSNKSLRLHQRMHDPIKTKEIEAPVEYGISGSVETDPNKPREMFLCTVCNKTYDKGYETIHMATHSGGNDYHCNICNRKFYTEENLDMHMRVHAGEKAYGCKFCKTSFDSEKKLADHMEGHSQDRPYQCGFCGRKFARPHEKVKHERIHTGEKPHECEICGKTFRVSYCLTLHMRTHTGARPYACKHCGKRFKAHSVYNHHLLTHSDARNYKCPYCDKTFKTGVQLAGHKNSHTKPFSCNQCNRPFASLYAVRSHMETHKRENNLKFNCYLCGASYARNFALRDHIKEQHESVVVLDSNGELTLDHDDKMFVDMEEGLKATTSILPDDDETTIALNELESEPSEEDL